MSCEAIVKRFRDDKSCGKDLLFAAAVCEAHREEGKYHYHLILLFKRAKKFSQSSWLKKFYGPLANDYKHFHLRRITSLKPALADYLLKDPQIHQPFALIQSNGTMTPITLEAWRATLDNPVGKSNQSVGVYHALINGEPIQEVLARFPGMGMRLRAVTELANFLKATKQNSWEASLPIEVDDNFFLRDPPIADVSRQKALILTLNSWREKCMNGEQLSVDARLWIIGQTGLHKSSLFTFLATDRHWPIVMIYPEDRFPGDPFKLFEREARPLILIENCEPKTTSVRYKDMEIIMDRAPGSHLEQKGSQYTFPNLLSPIVFIGNHSPDTWYRNAPSFGEQKGSCQLSVEWRAALQRRFKSNTIFLKTPLNFFANPQSGGFGVIMANNDDDFDQAEAEFMNI